MNDGTQFPQPIRFGAFEVDFRTGELRKYGVRVKLQDKPFQILTILLDRRGELVAREELRQRLWPAGIFVDFDRSLNTAINRLREALGDFAENPRFVETVPRRGYRFIAPVNGADAPHPGNYGQRAFAGAPGAEQVVHLRQHYIVVAVVALLLGALLAVAAYVVWNHIRSQTKPSAGATMLVSPLLDNLGGDRQLGYIDDDTMEEIIPQPKAGWRRSASEHSIYIRAFDLRSPVVRLWTVERTRMRSRAWDPLERHGTKFSSSA